MKNLKILLVVCVTLFSFNAEAHSGLVSSSPENQATVTSPEFIVLEYTGEVNLLKLELMDQTGEKVDINFAPIAQKSDQFKVSLPTLETGKYMVHWMVIGGDSHKMKGDFSFQVVTEMSSEKATETSVEQTVAPSKHSHQGS